MAANLARPLLPGSLPSPTTHETNWHVVVVIQVANRRRPAIHWPGLAAAAATAAPIQMRNWPDAANDEFALIARSLDLEDND